MPATQEQAFKTVEDSMKKSEGIRQYIHQEVMDKMREKTAEHDENAKSDPMGIADAITSQYGDKVDFNNFKTKDSDGTERNFQQLKDMGMRVQDWLNQGGNVFSEKANRMIKMSFSDAVHSKDMHMIFKKVVSNIVIEHSEPQSNLLSLYEKIRFTSGTHIEFPVWSPGGQSLNYVLPETGEPNELTGDLSSFITASSKRVGIKSSITEQAMENSVIDIYRMQLKWCGQALGRFKEMTAVKNLFATAGQKVLFDNNTTSGIIGNGYTSGRNAQGALNGTLSVNDIYDAYAYGMFQGADLRLLVIHPLAWRALANLNAAGSSDWALPRQGDQNRGNLPGSGLSKVFQPGYNNQKVASGGAGKMDSWATQASSMVGVANPFGLPFTIITSPYAPIKQVSTLTSGGITGAGATQNTVNNAFVCDILMLDPRDVGVHVVNKELYSREESKFFDQIKETALFESYGFASSNKGGGMYTIKNVAAIAGYDIEAQPITRQINTLDGTIPPSNSIVGGM